MPSPAVNVRGMVRLWRPRGGGVPIREGAALVERILAVRGLTDPGMCQDFLNPVLKHLHAPGQMPGIDRAAARILGAIRGGEPLVIYGDYDVDGITATAILFHVMKAIAPGAAVRCYIPHRMEEGYGLNSAALRQLASEGARVVVTVDCGITAVEPAAEAAAAGIDLIITDHHNPPRTMEDLPRAYEVVHPRRPDSEYPFGELCGAGVAFKLAWRLATMGHGSERVGEPMRSLLLDLLAFAALGTIADVMPLVGENRVIARHGLARIKHSAVAGLSELVKAAGLAGESIDSEHVGFALAPRLNACGRMGHAREAVELFTTATPAEAAAIAQNLCKLNEQRRATERRIAEQAAEMAEAAGMTGDERRAIVLAHEEWHQGVVGIVCSRLVERFHRPTILMCVRDGQCHGSGRSIEGFSLHAALERCSGHLLRHGGHDMAAGLTLEACNLGAFTEAFTDAANASLAPGDLVPVLKYDCDASLAELTPHCVGQLESLAPFGMKNPRPKVRISGVRVGARPQVMGNGGRHLSLQLGQDGHVLRAVAWNWGEHAGRLAQGMPLDVVISPKISAWNGMSRVEAEISDIAIGE
jgi:single-stranded-DNA-specific exonuclease